MQSKNFNTSVVNKSLVISYLPFVACRLPLALCILPLSLCLFLSSCKQQVKLPQQEAEGLSADFVQFYDKFHNDSVYQMAHIAFPLEGFPSGAMADSIKDVANFRWTADKWVMHRPMTLTDSLYSRRFEQPMPIMVNEVIIDKKTKYGILRRFLKRDNDWQLIYYSDMNRMENK
jgi:hypothetical protein